MESEQLVCSTPTRAEATLLILDTSLNDWSAALFHDYGVCFALKTRESSTSIVIAIFAIILLIQVYYNPYLPVIICITRSSSRIKGTSHIHCMPFSPLISAFRLLSHQCLFISQLKNYRCTNFRPLFIAFMCFFSQTMSLS